MGYSPQGPKESDRTEQLNNSIGGGGSCLKMQYLVLPSAAHILKMQYLGPTLHYYTRPRGEAENLHFQSAFWMLLRHYRAWCGGLENALNAIY